jgi:hypothetical protein
VGAGAPVFAFGESVVLEKVGGIGGETSIALSDIFAARIAVTLLVRSSKIWRSKIV